MLMSVATALTGFSDFNLVILAGDIGMLVGILTIAQRLHTLMKRKRQKSCFVMNHRLIGQNL